MAKINIERYFEENNGMLFPAEFTISLDSSDQELMDEMSKDYNLLTVEPGQDKIIVSLPSKRSMIEGAADQINDLIDRVKLSWENAGDNIPSADINISDDSSSDSEYTGDYQLINEYSSPGFVSKLIPEKSSLRDHLRFKSSSRVWADSSGDEISEDAHSAGDKLNFPLLKKSSPLDPDSGGSALTEPAGRQESCLPAEYVAEQFLPGATEDSVPDEFAEDIGTEDFLNIDEISGISGFEESGDVPSSADALFGSDESLSDEELVLQNSGLVLPDLPPEDSDFLSSAPADLSDDSMLSELSFIPEDISEDDELTFDDSLSSVIPEDAFCGEFPDEFGEEGYAPVQDELSGDYSDLDAALGDDLLSESDFDAKGSVPDRFIAPGYDDTESLVLPDLPGGGSEILSSDSSESEIISDLIPDNAELENLSDSIAFEGLDEFGDLSDIDDVTAEAVESVSGSETVLPDLPDGSDDLSGYSDDLSGFEDIDNFEGLDEFGDLSDIDDVTAEGVESVSGSEIVLPDLPDGSDDLSGYSADLSGFEDIDNFEGLDEFGDLSDIDEVTAEAVESVSGSEIVLPVLPEDSADLSGFEDIDNFEGLDEFGDLSDIDEVTAEAVESVSGSEFLTELSEVPSEGLSDELADDLLSDYSDDFAEAESYSGATDAGFIAGESGTEPKISALPEYPDTDKPTDEDFSGDEEEYFRNLTEGDPSDSSGWSGLGRVLAEKGMSEEAEYAFNQAVNLDFGNEEALMGLFYIFKGKKCYGEAVEFITVLIRKKPWDSSLLYEKAIVEEMAGNNEVAERELKKAVILDPENTLAWAKLALILVKKGRKEEALECYSELTKLKPGVSEVWYSKGLVLKSLQRTDEALFSFEKCLEINPADDDAQKEKAGILLAEGKYSDAERVYEGALKSDPKSLWALSGLALSYENTGHNEKALNVYNNILEINPADISALEKKAEILLKSHLFAEAKDVYIEISSLEQDNADIWLTIAKLSENSGQFDEAMEGYNRVLKIDPANQDGLRGRIRVLVSQGRYEESLPDYNFLIIQNPSDASLIADKAIACIRTGKPDEAIVLYNSALNLDKKNTKILMELIDLLTSLGRLEEALPVYDRLISLMPEETDLLISKGLILAGVKRHREAVSCFNRVLAKKPGDPEIMLNLGISLLCLGEKEKALRCYKKSLEADPEFGNRWLESGISAASFLMAKEPVISGSSESYGYKKDFADKERKAEIKRDPYGHGRDYPYGISGEDLEKYAREFSEDKVPAERPSGRDISGKIPDERPGDPNELVRKGIELTKSGYYDIAEKSLIQALDIDDYNESGYFSLGVLYGKTGRYTEAIDCFEKVLMINPSNKKAGRGIIMARNKA
ncbi:tetratricopeptide repeat protein [Methanoplanus limicola]|uniref:Tetratricopeptide TPR_2 repeat-containing protein n=1 Tax=Methanoplanus limicola DSM 2279 TaxID=937775 RepID=H1YZ80_9EURY|nr:tetratricopeptide repeat protein [Methanoplanus limicola]EHQ35104.1 Tetratricopeptide TPR_2 repeat-containing protein [Methanoplanus limicola DSM 2279]